MNKTFAKFSLFITLFVTACGSNTAPQGDTPTSPSNSSEISGDSGIGGGSASSTPKSQATQTSSDLKTIRDHFIALPDKYFVLEGCDRAKDRDCQQAKKEYLKTYLEVDDTKNGYLKAGCDGGQSCIEMAIFRKPDGNYVIAVSTTGESITEQYFLIAQNGQWNDIGSDVIPDYGSDKIYQVPRQGTTMGVFEKKVTEKGVDYEISEKGKKLYDLVWKDGKFDKK